ncbi:hypothetical protein RUM44_002782 [Polyplax serrata]|uniref:Uncharacterized protein n=1 Tax=Polyplax serrata TaxID=468196 RepID=A0ABR1AFR8_POLSC
MDIRVDGIKEIAGGKTELEKVDNFRRKKRGKEIDRLLDRDVGEQGGNIKTDQEVVWVNSDLVEDIYLVKSKSSTDDLIVLDLNWLCRDVIGSLLSANMIGKTRMTGCYTEPDLQTSFPYGPADRMLDLLCALEICTKCEYDEEVEYEFPCYNLVEKMDGLWNAEDERYNQLDSCY